MGRLVLRMPRRGKKFSRAERARRRPCALKGRCRAWPPAGSRFCFPLFPVPHPPSETVGGDGTLGRKFQRALPVKKIQNIRLIMPLATVSYLPASQLCGGGSGKEPLRFLPSPVCLLRYIGLEQELAGGGTVLEHHGIGHGFEPLHTLRHFGGYGGDGVGKLVIAAGFQALRATSPASSRFSQRAPSGPESGVARKRISWSGNAFHESSMVLASSSLVGTEP